MTDFIHGRMAVATDNYKECIDELKASGVSFVMLPPDPEGKWDEWKQALTKAGIEVRGLY